MKVNLAPMIAPTPARLPEPEPEPAPKPAPRYKSPACPQTRLPVGAHCGSTMRGKLLAKCMPTLDHDLDRSMEECYETTADALATAALQRGSSGKLAAALLPRGFEVGPCGHTMENELALFADFKPAGFVDEETTAAKAQRLLLKAFKVSAPAELPGAVATALGRVNAGLHRLAAEAHKLGLVPGTAKVGFDTTLDEERRLFGAMRVGF